MGDVFAAGDFIRANLDGVVFPCAELTHVELLVRSIYSFTVDANLSGADKADVVRWLLAPDHLSANRLSLSQRDVLDLEAIRQQMLFGEAVNPVDHTSVDGVVGVDW